MKAAAGELVEVMFWFAMTCLATSIARASASGVTCRSCGGSTACSRRTLSRSAGRSCTALRRVVSERAIRTRSWRGILRSSEVAVSFI